MQNKMNAARSQVELVEASSSLTQVECLTSIQPKYNNTHWQNENYITELTNTSKLM